MQGVVERRRGAEVRNVRCGSRTRGFINQVSHVQVCGAKNFELVKRGFENRPVSE